MGELTDGEVRRTAFEEHARWYGRRQRASWRAPRPGEKDADSIGEVRAERLAAGRSWQSSAETRLPRL